jgi:hypothetical protein
VFPRPIPARRSASFNSARRSWQIWYVLFHVSGCCQISRGVCSSPRSAFSCSGKSSSVRKGSANETPPVEDSVVYYSATSLQSNRKKMKYSSQENAEEEIAPKLANSKSLQSENLV